jgi:hypothetical protein
VIAKLCRRGALRTSCANGSPAFGPTVSSASEPTFPRDGIDTGTLAGFGPAFMVANDNDLIRSPPIPA